MWLNSFNVSLKKNRSMLRFMLQDKLVLFIKEIIRKIGSVVPKKKKKGSLGKKI